MNLDDFNKKIDQKIKIEFPNMTDKTNFKKLVKIIIESLIECSESYQSLPENSIEKLVWKK